MIQKLIKWAFSHPTVVVLIMLGISIVCIIGLLNSNSKYKELYNRELQNVAAYQTSNSNLRKDAIEYQMTIKELRASKDTLDAKILSVIDGLKIKDKNITNVYYQEKLIEKHDTLRFSDTIFVPNVKIDTTLADAWYSLKLNLEYPSKVSVSPKFRSEQYAIFNTKKEYVNKRSKWFFIRWFQKKYDVTEVKVVEKSPYVTNKEQKFINIVK